MERTGEARKPSIALEEPGARRRPRATSSSIRRTGPSRRDDDRGRRAAGRAAVPRPRPHRPRHRDHRPRDADVVFAGDLVENGARPVRRRRLPARLGRDSGGPRRARRPGDGVIVPGHGDHAGRAFADAQAAAFARTRRARPRGPRRLAAASTTRSPRSRSPDYPTRSRLAPAFAAGPEAARRASSTDRPRLGRHVRDRTTQRPRAEPATIPSRAGSSVSRVTSCDVLAEGARAQVGGEPVPECRRRRPISTVTESIPSSATAAQDEREDGRLELRAAGVAARRDRGPGLSVRST